MISCVCLVLAVLLAFLGWLANFKARLLPLFYAAVPATELGHFLAIGALALAVLSPHGTPAGLAATAIASIAAVALVMPVLRAFAAASKIRASISRSLGRECGPTLRPDRLFLPPVSHSQPSQRLTIERSDGQHLHADFFPAQGAVAPLVVVLHGGGWMAGNSTEFAGWNRWLAARGFAVLSVDYGLVPNAVWPRQREDVLDATGFVRARAAEFCIDPDRVVLLGRSAGGQIAGAIAAHDAPPWVRGCICLYTPIDMIFAYDLSRDDDMLKSRCLIRNYLLGTPDNQPNRYREASAYLSATENCVPFLLLHGLRDELVWEKQSERFAARLTDLRVRHAFVAVPWGTHAFDYNINGPGGQVAAAAIEAFLASVL